jgi:hypothetical protein
MGVAEGKTVKNKLEPAATTCQRVGVNSTMLAFGSYK